MAVDDELDPDVAWYYELGLERDRLSTSARLECLRTQELLERFLPAAPARVLDVGGGPGEYATWLAARGHDATLVDPVALHIEQARERGVASAMVGDARSLDFDDESVDAVLLLGRSITSPTGTIGSGRCVKRTASSRAADVLHRSVAFA